MTLIYDFTDYKIAIKTRVKELKVSKPKISLRFLSELLDIQYTFLSKVLNSETVHLSEDQVFIIGQSLDYLTEEIDYLLLLRSCDVSSNSNRKNILKQKISTIQKSHALSVDAVTALPSHGAYFGDEMKYLFDFNSVIIHVALFIKDIQKNPNLMIQHLGIDLKKIKDILILLDRLGQIEYDAKTHKIINIKNTRPHYGKDHPLTRTHQLIMKTQMNQNSFSKSEDLKENLLFTFTTDQNGAEAIKRKLKEFAHQIQQITMAGKHTGVYQMNLDFLEVLSTELK
jgi:Domain of unknown function (DUF4423)